MKDVICDLIGRYVATKRLERGLTQDDLATRVGVSRQALSMIERGAQAPRWETIYALAEELHCEVWDLTPTIRQVRLRAEGA